LNEIIAFIRIDLFERHRFFANEAVHQPQEWALIIIHVEGHADQDEKVPSCAKRA
jgi:hypothetical protein